MHNTSTPSAKSSPPCRILLINTSPLFSKRIEVPYSSINEVSCTQEAQCAQLQDVLCRQLLQHQFDQVRSHVPLLDWMAGLLQVRAAPRAFGLWGDAVVFLKVRLCEVCTVHFCGWTALAMDCCGYCLICCTLQDGSRLELPGLEPPGLEYIKSKGPTKQV